MNKQIKLFTVLSVAVVIGISFFIANPVSSQTNEQIIQQLQEQIMQLKAQITALQRQLSGVTPSGITPSEPEPVPTTIPVSSECPEFSQRLYPGVSDASTGGEVTKLQKMLANDPNIYPEGLVTGYYGLLTEKAVQRWQTKQGVVSSGNPATTGYGVVGPQTRTRMVIACPTPVPRPIPPSINAGYLEIEPSSASIAVDESKSFQAFYQPPMPKCPEGFACPQVMPARFPVEAEWTSSNPNVASIIGVAIADTTGHSYTSAQVKGISNGTADIKAAYKPSSGAVLAATARVTVGSVSSVSSITVISPNGGETWAKESTQTIKWQDNTPVPLCPVGAACAPQAPKYFDIKLLPYYPPCTTNLCPAYYPSPYTIAKSVYGPSYSWSVGKYLDVLGTGTGGIVSGGSYTVQVCQTGTSICDSSDSYFKIISGGTSTNNPPVINGIPAMPSSIQLNQSVSFSWDATDADKDNLSWSVNWGDGAGSAGVCAIPVSNLTIGTNSGTNFTAFHSWSKAGTYTVKATVNDCKGGSDAHTFNVTVGKFVQTSVTVISPNGGETWTKGTTQTIKWQDNTPVPLCPVGAACAPQAPKYFDIKLLPYYPPCTTNLCPAYYPSPYTIAKSVYGPSYSWSVGKYLNVLGTGTGGVAPDGSYTVQVCQTGTSICDSSDNYFKIVSGTTTNNSPVINSIPAIPVNVRVGQSVSFSWGATDADGDNLSWGVSWGDGTGVAGACQSPNPQNKQGWTFNEYHTWSSPGTYTVTATVNDCRGGSNEHNFVVSVN